MAAIRKPQYYGFSSAVFRSRDHWWPAVRIGPNQLNGGEADFALWVPLLIFLIPSVTLWWLDRRRTPPGQCPRCGYDLTGNVSGVCPECGTTPAATHAPQQDHAA